MDNDLITKIKELINLELNPRIRPFSFEVELSEVSLSGSAKISIRKNGNSVWYIRQEVLEYIIVSTITANVPQISKVIVYLK